MAKKGAPEVSRNEQFGELQSPPQSPVRLSCAEIRHLFWQLVLVVERSVQVLLDWSSWRRWHQAWARYYHYRRRGKLEQPRSEEQKEVVATERERTDEVWRRLEPLLPDTD